MYICIYTSFITYKYIYMALCRTICTPSILGTQSFPLVPWGHAQMGWAQMGRPGPSWASPHGLPWALMRQASMGGTLS